MDTKSISWYLSNTKPIRNHPHKELCNAKCHLVAQIEIATYILPCIVNDAPQYAFELNKKKDWKCLIGKSFVGKSLVSLLFPIKFSKGKVSSGLISLVTFWFSDVLFQESSWRVHIIALLLFYSSFTNLARHFIFCNLSSWKIIDLIYLRKVGGVQGEIGKTKGQR